jgi:S1-C subfamily serine protease
MRDIRPGERLDIATGRHLLRLSGADMHVFAGLDALILPLLAGDRAAPALLSGGADAAIQFQPGTGIAIDLAAILPETQRLLVVLHVIGGPQAAIGLDSVREITAEIDGFGRLRLDTNGRREAALILIEFYRRGSGWRLAAPAQGFVAGVPGIEAAYNTRIDLPYVPPPHPGGRFDEDREPPPPRGSSAGGSGFVVAPRLIVTNHHVIVHAADLACAAGGAPTPARLVASDPINDIALLEIGHDAPGIAQFRSDSEVDLGEDVIVAGFPLQNILGQGPQISAGNVSALSGPRGDSGVLQFTSPIGSGSSGGPIHDCSGLIVGLVRSVLRHDLHDTIAQNINFGVKAVLVQSFLHAAGVSVQRAAPGTPLPRAEIARRARAWLARIDVRY